MYHTIDHEEPETKLQQYLFSGFINCFVNLQSLKYQYNENRKHVNENKML